MIIKKKTIFLISLIILLFVVGYINHQLTKQSLLNSSSEYQEYEEKELSELLNDDSEDTIETSTTSGNSNEPDGLDIVDSKDNEVSTLSDETNKTIEEAISSEESIKKSNYFVEYRLSRDKLRSSLIERLNGIINNENTDAEVRKEAQKEIIKIGDIAEKELYMEGLIKAKGFDDALVFLSDDDVRVVVSTNELTEQEVMKILEIVKSVTNVDTSKIKIMKKF